MPLNASALLAGRKDVPIRGGQLQAIWPKKSLPLQLKIAVMTIKKLEGQMTHKFNLQKWYQPAESCCVVDY